MQKNTKWFSIIEIIIVIAIIGILGGSLLSFSTNKKTEQEKANRFTNEVLHLIDTEKSNNLIGKTVGENTLLSSYICFYPKGPADVGQVQVIQETDSTTSTGMLWQGAYYYAQVQPWVAIEKVTDEIKELYSSPFYALENITTYSKEQITGTNSDTETISDNACIQIQGSEINIVDITKSPLVQSDGSPVVWLEIELSYRDERRLVFIDKRTGKTKMTVLETYVWDDE